MRQGDSGWGGAGGKAAGAVGGGQRGPGCGGCLARALDDGRWDGAGPRPDGGRRSCPSAAGQVTRDIHTGHVASSLGMQGAVWGPSSLGPTPRLQPWAESWGPLWVLPFPSPQASPFKAQPNGISSPHSPPPKGPLFSLPMPASLPTVPTGHWKTDQLSPPPWETAKVTSRLIVAHTHTQPRPRFPGFPALSPCPACGPAVPPPPGHTPTHSCWVCSPNSNVTLWQKQLSLSYSMTLLFFLIHLPPSEVIFFVFCLSPFPLTRVQAP